ncbi:MAG TPA: hypothetical protein VJL61_12275 [Rhodanobacteraceae bacterium]|nr:hypothetical protein [Rhodanobacteraceae bacterium]
MAEPDRAWISKESRFGDTAWTLDNLTPGQQDAAGRIDWEFGVSNNLRFSHRNFDDLRRTLKRFVWSMICERSNGLPLTAGSMRKVSTGVKSLVRWMFQNEYRSLSELTMAASEAFIEDVQEECRAIASGAVRYSSEDDGANDQGDSGELDEVITAGQLRPRLQIWSHLWAQRDVMLRSGPDALPQEPFSGRSARSIADELATKAAGWIPPVPDEVALPVMGEARKWVLERSDDILLLQDLYLVAYDKAAGCVEDYRATKAKVALETFRFSIDPSTGAPWRGVIGPTGRATLFNSNWRYGNLGAHEVFRALVEDLCAACMIVIQGEAGPRINEICGLIAGGPSPDGLARIVEMRSSKTGLNEHFFMRGLLSKMQQGPREVEWLIGSRPTGTIEVPAPVRAVWVLERLFEPLRERTADSSLRDSLIVQFTAPRGYPRDGIYLGRPLGAKLRKLQRQFVANNVDLSGLPDRNKLGQNLAEYRDSKGACLRTHSWRKTFAQFVFKTDPRMTSAIAQQFHHLSLAMTEEGYLGNDPTLLEVMDSVRHEQTALVFYELVRGERPAAGRMMKLVDQYREELAHLVETSDRAEGIEAVKRWVIKEDLRIWFSKHGKCFIKLAPAKSRCHQLGGTVHWGNAEPNFAYRTPDVCLGCSVYAVDAEHAAFWQARLIENARWLQSDLANGGARMVAELRLRQSQAVLRAIGANMPELEDRDAHK